MARVMVLDAMGLAYRAHYAFIARPLVNSRGENTSALFGFANTVLKLRREEKPDYWALAWDGPGPTFRHLRYPEYKSQRKPMPEDLVKQLGPLEELAQALGLPVIEIPGAEADDVMATLAARGSADGHEVVLVTGDKDMLQIVGGGVRVLAPRTRDEYEWIDSEQVRAKWGVGPEHIRDLLALMGDTSDNIPGVPGVGEKTAVELMSQFGSLDELYAHLDQVKRPALRAKLETNRELAMLSRELATVRPDLAIEADWDALRQRPIRRDMLLAFAKRHEIRRLQSIAEAEGVDDASAGAPAWARPAERHGTAAEMSGLDLREPASPAPPPAAAPPVAASSAVPPSVAPPPVARSPLPPSPPLAPPLSALPPSPGPLFDPSPSAVAPQARSSRPAFAPSGAATRQGTLDLWSGTDAAAESIESGAASEAALHAVRARAVHGWSLLPILGGEDPRRSPLVGLAIAARDGTACYVPLRHETGGNRTLERAREWLGPALADPTVPKTGWDIKSATHALAAAGMPVTGFAFDARIGAFLCDPVRDLSLEALARDFLGEALPSLEAPPARGKARPTFATLSAAAAGEAAAQHAAALYRVEIAVRAQLESREQWPLYASLEHPLVDVLLDMERAGIALDPRVLTEMSGSAAVEIQRLEDEMAALAGERLNWNSGAQVSRVLFETLSLQPGRRTKTGLSTDQAVLEELAASHPFPAKLLEYRALDKLRSTYLDALPGQVDEVDGRIHTTFDPCGAATGRLSSSRPNLQNIPMRTELGRGIRRAFVAPPGGLLVGADYSQIELRIMAHLSGDPQLIAAFESGEDVHANTARRIFGVGEGPLDPALRARAKVVNFGVMYGMGARSLSQQMGIGLAEAQEFIAGYFRVYARVREFLDLTVERARRDGYVRTLLGRRRWLPELASENGGTRSFAERAAINTPIQGSAADLMKLAMLRVHRGLKASVPSARLLLQVHDELLLECAERDAPAVAERVRAEMEGCFALRVPLLVSVGTGRTWFDVH
jgi:DNA polymerase-1